MDGKVVIVGGGLGGLAAGVALRRAGFEIAIFEKSSELREIGAGLSVWPNATQVLETLGLLEAARACSGEILRLELCDPNGRLLSRVTAPGRFPTPSLCIQRADLLALLAGEIPATCIHLGMRFESYEERNGQVATRFINGEEVEGHILVGADGLFSEVRAALFGPAPPVYRGCHAWRGLAEYRHGLDGAAIEFWGAGRRFGIEPLGGNRVFWYAVENAPQGKLGDPATWKTQLSALFAGWDRRVLDVIEATPAGALFCHDLYDRMPLPRWGRGRITLLGDAAHPTTPHLGQGACMALEDAQALARCLADMGTTPEALQQYKCERLVRTSLVTVQSREIGWLGQWETPLAVSLRTRLLRMTPRFLYEVQHAMLFKST